MDFSQYDDEYLVELSLTCDEAKEALFRRFKGHIRLMSRSYFIFGGDQEDLAQEGMIGLYKAIRNFKPSQGETFKAFATVCIKNQILDAIKRASRKKHMPLNHYLPMDSTNKEIAHMTDKKVEPELLLLNKEDEERLQDLIQNSLTKLEANILRHFVAGLSYEEIASVTGRTVKSVDNALARARQKMSRLI